MKKHSIIAIYVQRKKGEQYRLLAKVIVPDSMQPNLLTINDIENDIVVFDGGVNTPSMQPPDGVTRCSISVLEGNNIYVQDELDPNYDCLLLVSMVFYPSLKCPDNILSTL
jgi:hypothetical protein